MDYKVWRDVYLVLGPELLTISGIASEASVNQGVTPGPLRFMWPDAVASFLFDQFADRK